MAEPALLHPYGRFQYSLNNYIVCTLHDTSTKTKKSEYYLKFCVHIHNIEMLLTDIDECAATGANAVCQHKCTNIDGSYVCSCRSGYTLAADGKTCESKHFP